MNTAHAHTAGSQTRLHRADHAGAAYDADIAECRAAVSAQEGLDYIAHVTCGVFDFAIAGAVTRAATDAFDRAVRRFSLVVAQLDSACEPLDSGPLIRVILQGGNGAVFQVLKVAGQTYFGLTLDGTPSTVDFADRRLARLAESAARRIGAVSLRWGGFRSPRHDDSPGLWLPSPAAANITPFVTGQDSIFTPSAREACRRALHRADLHYVALYRLGQPSWCADIFDDPALAPLFQRVTPTDRRQGYGQLVRHITLQARRLRQMLTLVRSDHLVRLVLDVARGAIYVLPLNEDNYLVGVTLYQEQVEQTEQKMRALLGQLQPADARLE